MLEYNFKDGILNLNIALIGLTSKESTDIIQSIEKNLQTIIPNKNIEFKKSLLDFFMKNASSNVSVFMSQDVVTVISNKYDTYSDLVQESGLNAIKELKNDTGLGLKNAKEFIDLFYEYQKTTK